MSIVSNTKLEEVFSLALEERSPDIADLVSNANAPGWPRLWFSLLNSSTPHLHQPPPPR